MAKQPNQTLALSGKQLPADIVASYRRATRRLFLLDYDGTLVDLTPTPPAAKPPTQLLTCLDSLVKDSKNTVVIISGRDRFTLDNWLGHLPLVLVAEHGALNKTKTGWQSALSNHSPWKATIKPILANVAASVPGAVVEEKQTAIVFHYRPASNQKLAAAAAKALAQKLASVVGALSLAARHDGREMVVEVKQADADKGRVAGEWLKREKYDFILCAGDSTSDEAMFKVLPAEALSIKVGPEATTAGYRINKPDSLIECLKDLIKNQP